MKSPNLFIITFLLFITDLNHTGNCEKSTAPSNPPDLADLPNLQNPTSSTSLQKPSNIASTQLKLFSIISKERNDTKPTTKEHSPNASSVTEAIDKNRGNQLDKQPKRLTNDKSFKKKPHNSTVKVATNSTRLEECSKSKLDYLVLSLNWPINICSKKACILNSDRWFVHNLGYVNLQGDSHCCAKRPFNTSELGMVTTNELREHMQSVLATKPDESFWFEEWSNVGTCLVANEKLSTIYKYFSETVRLFKEIDLENWLKERNIVPSDDINKVYDFKSFYQAIYVKRPYKFQVICNPMLDNRTGVSIIDYVNFCLDNDLNKIHCPSVPQLESNCNKNVVFPTLDAIESVMNDKQKRSSYKASPKFGSKASHYESGQVRSSMRFKNLHDLGPKQSGWISITTKEDLNGSN